jgi:hypothetical protein
MAFIYRAFFALPPMSVGWKVTNAVWALHAMLAIVWRHRAGFAVVRLRASAPTALDPKGIKYKAGRRAMPASCPDRMVADVLRSFSIPIHGIPDAKTDDLIGTVFRIAERGPQNLIVSGDLDCLQLVSNLSKPSCRGAASPTRCLRADRTAALSADPTADRFQVTCAATSATSEGAGNVGDKTTAKLVPFGDRAARSGQAHPKGDDGRSKRTQIEIRLGKRWRW